MQPDVAVLPAQTRSNLPLLYPIFLVLPVTVVAYATDSNLASPFPLGIVRARGAPLLTARRPVDRICNSLFGCDLDGAFAPIGCGYVLVDATVRTTGTIVTARIGSLGIFDRTLGDLADEAVPLITHNLVPVVRRVDAVLEIAR